MDIYMGEFIFNHYYLIFSLLLPLIIFIYIFTVDRIFFYSHTHALESESIDGKNLYAMLESLAEKINVPCPQIFICRDSFPNAFIVSCWRKKHSKVVLTEGLLQLLSQQELKEILGLCLAQVKLRSFRMCPIASFLVLPFAYMSRRKIPMGISFLFYLLSLSLICFLVDPRRCYKADHYAATIFEQPGVLARALQKMASLSSRIIPHEQNLAMEHLFLISPSPINNLFFYGFTHPSFENRIEKLIALSLT